MGENKATAQGHKMEEERFNRLWYTGVCVELWTPATVYERSNVAQKGGIGAWLEHVNVEE